MKLVQVFWPRASMIPIYIRMYKWRTCIISQLAYVSLVEIENGKSSVDLIKLKKEKKKEIRQSKWEQGERDILCKKCILV